MTLTFNILQQVLKELCLRYQKDNFACMRLFLFSDFPKQVLLQN
jgi:hypothetical protein